MQRCCWLKPAPAALAQETVVYSFKNTTDGNFPNAGVVLDKNGNLYGTTPVGGNTALCEGDGCGVVFEMVHNSDGTWTDRTIYTFAGGTADGASPYSSLVFDSRGHLFGVTYYGGSGTCNIGQFPGCGTVFELVHNSSGGWTETVLYNFQGGNDGAFPDANLILDAQGNLYGTTYYGGVSTACLVDGASYGCGTLLSCRLIRMAVGPKAFFTHFRAALTEPVPVVASTGMRRAASTE